MRQLYINGGSARVEGMSITVTSQEQWRIMLGQHANQRLETRELIFLRTPLRQPHGFIKMLAHILEQLRPSEFPTHPWLLAIDIFQPKTRTALGQTHNLIISSGINAIN
jgi:hypothetical protein